MNHVVPHCKRNASPILFMWIFYSLFAALCWGVSYASCGPLLQRGVNPVVFLMGYSLFSFIGSLIIFFSSGMMKNAAGLQNLSRTDICWFLFSVAGSALGAYLTYAAMGAKNPTLVSLIEISYPIFVVFFAWLFFGEMQLTTVTLVGGILVLTGVAVIIIGGK
jgi:drug/metabolite transporter (DMT)-like permease